MSGEIGHWQPAARLSRLSNRLPDIAALLIVKILH